MNKVTTIGVILSIGLLGAVAEAKNPLVVPQASGSTYTDQDTGGDWQEAANKIKAGAGAHQQLEKRNESPDITPAERQANVARQGEIVAQLDRNATRFPDNPVVQGAAAGAALSMNQPQKAQIYADRWESLAKPDSPEWAKAVNTGGLAALKTGDFKKAEAAARRVLDKFPKDKAALGLLHSTEGRVEPGAAHVSQATGPAPAFVRASVQAAPFVPTPAALNATFFLDRAANLIGMRDYRGAIDSAQRAAALDSSNPDPHMQQAVAWAALKNVSEAMLAISRAIERLAEGDPRLPGAYNTRALFKNKGGDYAGAATDAGEAIRRDPAMADAYYQRSVAQKGQGNTVESVADLKKAAELKPSDYKSLYDVAAREMEETAGAPVPDPRQKSALHKAWTTLLGKAGGSFTLFMGTMGAVFFLIAGCVLWFAKEGSTAARVRNFFTPAPAAGQVIGGGRYELGEELGRGGMGTVSLAWDNQLKRPVAIKSMNAELLPDADHRSRFMKEALLVAQLRHPNIGDVYAFCDEPSGLHIVFAYIKGRTIYDLLNDSPQRRMDPKYALELGLAIAKAIDYAHSQGVIHRDLKPGNVMLDEHGVVKVMDFGIARRFDNAQTTVTKVSVGTPAYMAPEQVRGIVTKQSDQFSFGVIMYELLIGRRPFNGMDAQQEMFEGRFTPPSQLLPSLAPAVDEVFKIGLHPDYKQRYESGVKFWEALKAAMSLPPSPGP